MKWSERVLPVTLSIHQRLLSRIQIQLDGAEAAKRRGEGMLVFFFQLTDAEGRIYQDHTSYDLEKVEEGLKSQDLVCTESAFVMPGDYSISLAIYDTATREHAIKKDKLHVPGMKNDPLPDAWRDLAPVEFVEAIEPPDSWFLPKERGKLYLPLSPHRPVRVEIVLNLAPSELSSRRYGVQDRNFSFLLPAFKIIAEMNSSVPHAANTPIDVSLLDISRRSTIFHQEDVHELDWEGIKSSLSKATTASIDVKSLADRQHNAAFFVSEVAHRMNHPADPGESRAVIVLSGPMVFDADQDLHGVDAKPVPDSRLFYIRFRGLPSAPPLVVPETRRRRAFGGYPGRRPEQSGALNPQQMDQLEPMLKALNPQLMDVISADQFRKVLSSLMTEISNM